MSVSFGNWSTDNVVDYKEKFDVVYDDDGQLILESKETFSHTDDDELPDFEYKYMVRCWDLPRFGSENKSISVELLMVVLPNYLCEDKLNRIMRDYDVVSVDDVYIDWCIDDCSVRFADEYVDYDENNDDGYYYILDNADVVERLNACASVFETMDRMRGFSLDKAWNMIGTTGWDVLRDVLTGENMIQATLARYR